MRDGRQIAAVLSTTGPVGNLLIAPQSLEAALEEVAAPIPRAEVEDKFDGLTDWHVSGERTTARIRPT